MSLKENNLFVSHQNLQLNRNMDGLRIHGQCHKIINLINI